MRPHRWHSVFWAAEVGWIRTFVLKVLKRDLIFEVRRAIGIATSRNCDWVIRKGCPLFLPRFSRQHDDPPTKRGSFPIPSHRFKVMFMRHVDVLTKAIADGEPVIVSGSMMAAGGVSVGR
jgi:hypothetical protein